MKVQTIPFHTTQAQSGETTISIIVPVFNDAENLASALNSILRQEYSHYEVIIINDASTDSSGLIADKFAADYPKFYVIHNRNNEGVGASRNHGLAIAKGDYIMFLDSDDSLIGDCLHGLSQLIMRQPDVELIVGRWIKEYGKSSNSQMFEDESVLKSNDPTALITQLNAINFPHYMVWYYLIRREFLIEKELQFLDVRVAEDQEFVAKILCLAASIAYFDKPMYLYRGTGRLGHYRTGQRISRSIDSLTGIGFVLIMISLARFLTENSQLGIERRNFIFSRIRSVNGLLIGRLPLLTSAEIEEIEKVLNQSVRRFNKLHDIFRDLKLFHLIKQKHRVSSLLTAKQEEESRVLSIMHNIDHKQVYIFCATVDASAIGSVLCQNGYEVLGLIDNELTLGGTIQDGFRVYGAEVLSSKTKKENRNCVVIVSQHSVEAFKDIYGQLIGYGLREENLRLFRPMWAIG